MCCQDLLLMKQNLLMKTMLRTCSTMMMSNLICIICLTCLNFGPGGLRAPPVVVDEVKPAIVFTYFFVQAGLHVPPVVADEAKLAIVFIYFFFFVLVEKN